MTLAALLPCQTPGCPRLIRSGTHCHVCVESGTVHTLPNPSRILHDAWYDSMEWRRYSKKYRQVHPLCKDTYHRHVGEVRPSEVVDHITPHRGSRSLFWAPRNHQPLCVACHNWKSVCERREVDPLTEASRISAASVTPEGGIITDPRLVPRITKKRRISA